MSDTPQPAPRDTSGEPGSVVEFPASSGGVSPPGNNLPLELSSLIGRGREIADVGHLLSGHRMLTLTGPGGSGKTRLAMAVAREVVQQYEDGAWLVELAPLSEPELVPQAVASVLGVREAPGSPLAGTLADHLRPRTVLLVLDNCEHLLEACAELAETLMRACPNLKVLATSRQALGVEGEALFVVPPLSLPDPRRPPAAGGLSGYEAARLFVERASAANPGFALTERNAVAVAQICRRLEGMPLAIELAAARARVISAEQIASRLEGSFSVLARGGRTAVAHHGTLRATMDWSHDLLSEEERILFRRLSVFSGGFTLEAAEAIGTGGDIDEEEVLDLLTSLVDKSLVLAEERVGQARHRLLETVGQYSSEKLGESGEEERIRRRHAEYYLTLAEGAEDALKGMRQAEWLDRLEAEHDNLRAAIGWALAQGKSEIALRLTASAAHLRYPRGYLSEGRKQLEAALALGGPASPRARAKALTEAGFFALEQSDHDQGQRSLEQSVLLYRELDDTYGVAHALECLVIAKTRLGDFGRATRLQEESLALFRELGHKLGAARSLNNLGILAQKQGDYERAIRLHQESLALLRAVGDSFTIGCALGLLAQASLRQGQLERSVALLEESQSLLRRLGDKLTLATTLRNLGEAMLRQGDGARAASVYGEGLALATDVGAKTTVTDCLEGLAEVALTRGQPARAARLLGTVEALSGVGGSAPPPLDSSRLDREGPRAAARSQLGGEAFEAARNEGVAMSLERAVEYALETPETPEEPPSRSPFFPAGLSAREVEVLRLVANGLTNAQVARKLFISPRTVNTHLTSAYRKTRSATRVEAARFAQEHDLL